MSTLSACTPICILEIELSQPLPALSAFDRDTEQRCRWAIALVRLHTQPLGVVEFEITSDALAPAALADRIRQALAPQIAEHLAQDGEPPQSLGADGITLPGTPGCLRRRAALLENAPYVSIVVATRDRLDSLKQCLQSLLTLEYPAYEIIIVDNAPSTSATADHIRAAHGDLARVRYVREDQPGLAAAHNRGLMEVQGDIVAFTDDDVIADRYWLAELVQGFGVAENVGGVTGMIFPAQLQTPAQVWTEQFGGFNKGFTRRIFDMARHRPSDPLFPYTAGLFGSGANMAFTTSALCAIGGFDNALGAGTPARGGDDLSAFFRLITRGYQLVYTPAAIIHHRHRRDYAGLRAQAYGYGVGLSAYLTAILFDKPGQMFDFCAKIPHGLRYALDPKSSKNKRRQADYPEELVALERQGMLYGPLAYLRSRWQSRKSQTRTRLSRTTLNAPSTAAVMDKGISS